ncbi:MAG: heme ABC exporter ATP-binding protein CcmA [Longimicrobiales bacterium]|nr:heme ABC exporter ATP-binding protein CcmA [Longimicrobiales bacterium]
MTTAPARAASERSDPSSDPIAGLGVHALCRRFGTHLALRDLETMLPAGRITTVLGPNGAGKSTLLRLLAGSLRPTAGSMSWEGKPLDTRSAQWRARLGVLSHQTHLYLPLTARENLAFHARMRGIETVDLNEALDKVGLSDRAHDRVEGFSRGMRQRLALARTLLHDPEVVLLDEPFTGLDARASRLLEGVLRGLRDGRRSVVLVTHALAEGLALADHLLILVRGRIALDTDAGALDPAGFAEEYHRVVDEAENPAESHR